MRQKILLPSEESWIKTFRKENKRKKYKGDGYLFKDEIDYLTSLREAESKKKFKLGRKVIQTKDYFGLKKGRIGWVTSTWPRTQILFEDGKEPDISDPYFAELLEPQNRYSSDLDKTRERIKIKNSKKVRKTRK